MSNDESEIDVVDRRREELEASVTARQASAGLYSTLLVSGIGVALGATVADSSIEPSSPLFLNLVLVACTWSVLCLGGLGFERHKLRGELQSRTDANLRYRQLERKRENPAQLAELPTPTASMGWVQRRRLKRQ